MAKRAVHISDIRAYKACRRKWSWSSPLRDNLEPNIPYVPFFSGRATHHCLEQYYLGGRQAHPLTFLEPWSTNELSVMEATGVLWQPEVDKFNEQLDLVSAMLTHYIIWQRKDTSLWCDENLEFLDLPNGQKALEVSFEVPLYGPSGRKSSRVFLQGRFDGLVRNKVNNTLWIWETKTTRSIKELTASLGNDEQAGAYIFAAEQMVGEPIAGVLYNMLRKKAPTQPEVLRDGTLSQKKSLGTSAEMYIEAIKKQHPNVSERTAMMQYGNFIRFLAESEDHQFFARIPVRRTPYEIKQLADELYTVALEMSRDSTPLYPSPSWTTCNFCSFKNPCLAFNAGTDYRALLEADFRPRENAASWRTFGNAEE